MTFRNSILSRLNGWKLCAGVQAICTLTRMKNSNVERAKIGEESYYSSTIKKKNRDAGSTSSRSGLEISEEEYAAKKSKGAFADRRIRMSATHVAHCVLRMYVSTYVHYVLTLIFLPELDFRPNIYQSIDDLKTLTKEPFYCEVKNKEFKPSNAQAGECFRGSTSTLRSTDGTYRAARGRCTRC